MQQTCNIRVTKLNGVQKVFKWKCNMELIEADERHMNEHGFV